jgi:hypothetical protein
MRNFILCSLLFATYHFDNIKGKEFGKECSTRQDKKNTFDHLERKGKEKIIWKNYM